MKNVINNGFDDKFRLHWILPPKIGLFDRIFFVSRIIYSSQIFYFDSNEFRRWYRRICPEPGFPWEICESVAKSVGLELIDRPTYLGSLRNKERERVTPTFDHFVFCELSDLKKSLIPVRYFTDEKGRLLPNVYESPNAEYIDCLVACLKQRQPVAV
jgi:hypothetical protein